MGKKVKKHGQSIDVRAIMREIHRDVQARKRTGVYRRHAVLLEKATADKELSEALGDTKLIDKIHLPPSHRHGITGIAANIILGKLYLASKSFFSAALSSQEKVNWQTRRMLATHDRRLSKIETVLKKVSVKKRDV